MNDVIPNEIKNYEKLIKENGRNDVWECLILYLKSKAKEISCDYSDIEKYVDNIKTAISRYKFDISRKQNYIPESFISLVDKIQKFCNSIEKEYNIKCFHQNDVFYYSSETPDITRWLAERITKKISAAPPISQTPQKIAIINTELIQQYKKEIREKAETMIMQFDETEGENKKAVLEKELNKLSDLLLGIEEKLYTTASVLGKEGNYDFVLPVESAEKFPNAIDLTEKVLKKIKQND
jgi:Skp family chaperone for outer membrane proteins